MKKSFICSAICLATVVSCSKFESPSPYESEENEKSLSLSEVAGILARLPLEDGNLAEVYDAVSSSSGNGYDEEYMMSDLFSSPGSGVGGGSKAGNYPSPLRDLFTEYLNNGTKAGIKDAQKWLKELSESDIQIYWPFSEDWNGKDYPIITFDPGFGAETNYGYEIIREGGVLTVRDSVLVDETVASQRPVWVINRNDDSAFTPYEMYVKSSMPKTAASQTEGKTLSLKSFKMLRNYDSWFAGASEFFLKMGAASAQKAADDGDIRNYTPGITDVYIVVKRKYVQKDMPFNAILVDGLDENMEKLALMITEDDGGTRTNWKCDVCVKIKSKSYALSIDVPYNEKDDIVWRGQLSADYFRTGGPVTGRFGDVYATFALE